MGLFILAEVFNAEGGIELCKAGITDKHLFRVWGREKGVEVVVVTGDKIPNRLNEVLFCVATGLANTVIEGLQFCGIKGAKGLAHEADADVLRSSAQRKARKASLDLSGVLTPSMGQRGARRLSKRGLICPARRPPR